MKKKLLSTVLAAAMVLTMTACGNNAQEPAAETGAAAETESAGAETESAGAQTESADASADGKTFIIATDTVFAPFEFNDASNNFVGIDVDLLAAIAEDQGFSYELNSLGWDAAVAAVQVGQADMLIAGASITDERKENGWIFSDGYYDATQTFVVAEGSDIASYEDLSGKQVVVKNGTAGALFADSLKDKYGFTVKVLEDSPTMYQDVISGNSAACVEDKPIMADSIKSAGLALQIPDGMESEGAPYGAAIMNEANQELLDMFNAGLANIRANGTYDEIIARYLGE